MPETPGIPLLEENRIRESISKNVWINLTGPAVGLFTEAFFGPSITVLQKNMGSKRVTTQADDTAQKAEECTTNKAVRGEVTPNQTVSPTMIVMAGKTSGPQKYIKVQKMYRIVLLGDTRAGKSSLANTIFGEDVFKDENKCQAESKSVHGRRLTLINTPDFSCPGRSEEELKAEILKCITEFTPGPHAFLIVVQSTEQQAVIEKICQYFSEEAFKYAAVVFTQDGQVSEGRTIKEFLDQSKCLSELVKKCKSRYHIINKYNQEGDPIRNQLQVEALFNTIDQILKENQGRCYSSKMLPEGDTCNKPNYSVAKNELIKLTGPAAESVAKAFTGPAVVVLTQGTTNEAEATDERKNDDETTTETKNEGQIEEGAEEEEEEEEEKEEEKDKEEKDNQPKRKQPGKSSGGGGLWSMLGPVFGFFLGLGTTVLGSIPIFTGMIAALKTVLGASVMQKISTWVMEKISKVGEWVMQKVEKWVIEKIWKVAEWGMQKIGRWIMQKIGKWMQKFIKLAKWMIQNIIKSIVWIKKMYQFFQALSDSRGVILLVLVFYSLVLSWLFLKVPFAETLILIQFLLLVIILAVIEL